MPQYGLEGPINMVLEVPLVNAPANAIDTSLPSYGYLVAHPGESELFTGERSGERSRPVYAFTPEEASELLLGTVVALPDALGRWIRTLLERVIGKEMLARQAGDLADDFENAEIYVPPFDKMARDSVRFLGEHLRQFRAVATEDRLYVDTAFVRGVLHEMEQKFKADTSLGRILRGEEDPISMVAREVLQQPVEDLKCLSPEHLNLLSATEHAPVAGR